MTLVAYGLKTRNIKFHRLFRRLQGSRPVGCDAVSWAIGHDISTDHNAFIFTVIKPYCIIRKIQTLGSFETSGITRPMSQHHNPHDRFMLKGCWKLQ